MVIVVLALVAVASLSWGARRLAAQANNSVLLGTLVALAGLVWWLLKATALLWIVAARLVVGEVRSW